jgi:hypothetical protein
MLKKILRHKLVGIFSVVSLVLSLAGFAWAYFSLHGIAGTTPLILHFNDILGISEAGGSDQLLFMGIFGVLVVIGNSFIAFAFDERDAILGKLIAVLTFVLSVLLFIGFASIIGVN